MSDAQIRDLQRAVEVGDADAAARLEIEVSRSRGEPSRLTEAQALALSLCILDAVEPLTSYRRRGRLVRCACDSRCRAWGWRTDAGAKRGDAVEARALAREFSAAVDRATARRLEAERPAREAAARAQREQAEREAAVEAADFAAIVARTPRALGWVDVWKARDRAEGTAKARYATKAMILRAVAEARETGRATAEADHDVAKSYKYPVSYSTVSARRVADSRDVRVTITRTQTWGSRDDTRASIIVPADLVIS